MDRQGGTWRLLGSVVYIHRQVNALSFKTTFKIKTRLGVIISQLDAAFRELISSTCPAVLVLFFFTERCSYHMGMYIKRERMFIIHHVVRYSVFLSGASFGNKDVHDYLQG